MFIVILQSLNNLGEMILEKKDLLLCQKTLTIVVVTIDYDETNLENLEIAVLGICFHRFLC